MKITGLLLAGMVLFLMMLAGSQAETVGDSQRREFKLPDIKKDCLLCHLSREVKEGSALLKKPVADLCIECHKERKWPNEHTVDIVPSMHVKGLPLTEGKMTCTTCHDVHRNPYGKLLRLPERDLCILCHSM